MVRVGHGASGTGLLSETRGAETKRPETHRENSRPVQPHTPPLPSSPVLQTDPLRALDPTQVATRGTNLNGLWLAGPVVRVSDGAEVGAQQPEPGARYRTDIVPTRYDPQETNLADVPALQPRGGVSGPVTIHVNGIDTPPQFALDNAQQYADLTGRPTAILYNATSNPVGDVVESAAQLARLRNDRAVQNLADVLVHELLSGKDVHIAAESQGAIITRNAIEVARQRLAEHFGQERPTGRRPAPHNEEAQAQADAALRRITVETFGGAAASYPHGPRYVHYINEKEGPDEPGDTVADAFGLGAVERNDPELQRRAGGERAEIVFMEDFDRGGPIANHVFASYLHELEEDGWVPPQERVN